MAKGNGKGNSGIINKPVTGIDMDDVLTGSSAILNGGDGDDFLSGSDLIEKIHGGDGDDFIFAGGGDDTVFGNDGFDTLVLAGSLRDMTLTEGNGNSYILTTAQGGTDTIKQIEALQFDDFTYFLGINNGVFTSADSATVDEDSAVTIDALANDFDAEGDAFSVTTFDAVSANGAAVTLVDGKFVYDAASVASFQDLNDGETASDSFTYTVTDAAGNTSTETVSVTVTGTNDAAPGVFDDLGVNPENTPIVQNWVPGGTNGYWTNISTFTNADDVHTLNVNNQVYSWLDDNFMGNRQTGYDFYDGDDIFAVRLGAAGGQGHWSRSGVDMGDGDDIFAMDIDSSGFGGIDGWHNAAEFVGGAGNDEFRFDIDVANYAVLTGQKMWMGDGNDSINITVDVANVATGHYGYGNHVTLDAGDDSYSVEINVQDGSSYNLLTGLWRGGDGDDTLSFTLSGASNIASGTGFGGRVHGDAGNDTFVFNVEAFATNVWGYGSNLIDGGSDYDTLVLEMGASSDYTLTDTGGGTYDLVYGGVTVDLIGIEEIQFSDATLFL